MRYFDRRIAADIIFDSGSRFGQFSDLKLRGELSSAMSDCLKRDQKLMSSAIASADRS